LVEMHCFFAGWLPPDRDAVQGVVLAGPVGL
jgi:hypothetical protein